ncbi:MAG: segregation/condensation protein A [bacterium]|nr:segregation/condensation protein A [bacterium]
MIAVKEKTFEGPLDLLLSLIEKERLDISKISLARITNDYLEKIQKIDATNKNLADFLVVASKLLYLKSRALLPVLSTEEEEEIEDLETQLKEYKKFKELSGQFAEIIDKNQRSFEPGVRNSDMNLFLPPENVDLNFLMELLKETLEKMPEEIKKEDKKVEIKITLEEKLDHLQGLIKKSKKFSFKSVIKGAKTRGEVIVTFLALLEMIKRKMVSVEQDKNFADITVKGL